MNRIITYTIIPQFKTTLVGTVHTLDSAKDKYERRDFLRALEGMNRLAIEGNECDTKQRQLILSRSGMKTYERLAEEVGPKPIRYLEKDVDWHNLAERHGMKREIFETLDALAVAGIVIQ